MLNPLYIEFCTGSKFDGHWDIERNGFGTYTFPDGSEYRGEFRRGLFHGDGILKIDTKYLVGRFNNGKCISYHFIFDDGLFYSYPIWTYCLHPDRRFLEEQINDINPVNLTQMTGRDMVRSIPLNAYDIEEGFMDEDTGLVCEDFDMTMPIRYVCPIEKKWIIENCRKSTIDYVGFNKVMAYQNISCEIEAGLDNWGSYFNELSEFSDDDDSTVTSIFLSSSENTSSSSFLENSYWYSNR